MTSDDPSCGTPPACGLGPQNACVPDISCSIGVQLTSRIDMARRKLHELGLRPYRVRLVWQTYNRAKQAWEEFDALELVPSRVRAMNTARYQAGEGGLYLEGPIQLDEVSMQYPDRLLMGWRQVDGTWMNWVEQAKPSEREFFYEVSAMRRCPGDPENPRHRFALASAIHHDAENFQLVFQLAPQIVERGAGGVDRALGPAKKTTLRL